MNSRLLLVVAIAASGLVSSFSGSMDAYYVQILTFIGINIILAVSLNLINGHTGQFSLGHAGFMAVGGYTAGFLTTKLGPSVLAALGGSTWWSEAILFSGALLVGGLAAAVAGWWSGFPPCACAAITSPSSRWALAKSSG